MNKDNAELKKKTGDKAANDKKASTQDPSTDDGEDDDDTKDRKGASRVMPDGTLVEMLYDPSKNETKFAVYKDGKVGLEEKVKINDSSWLLPYSTRNDVLYNQFILYPSEAAEYESNEKLYEEVRSFINQYVQLPEKFLSVLSVYAMMTWLYDKFDSISYIRISGMPGTGKTRVLSAAGHICYKPIMAGGSITPAGLFRTLDQFGGTLIFDEAELHDIASKEMLRVLRQGHASDFLVVRMEATPKGGYITKSFKVYGPKIIASLAKSNDFALESRCLSLFMYPVERCNRPTALPKQQFKQEALVLRNKLLMFRFRNFAKMTADESVLSGIKLPRLKQTALAVVSVANMLGDQPLIDVLEFLSEYEHELQLDQADSVEHDILECLLHLLDWHKIIKAGKIRIGSDLTEEFNLRKYEDYSDREAKEYKSESGLLKYPALKVSPKKIGGYVKRMGIRVERDRAGFYINIRREYQTIRLLAKRYGLTVRYKLPENKPAEIEEILTEEEAKEQKEMDERNRIIVTDESSKKSADSLDDDSFDDQVPNDR